MLLKNLTATATTNNNLRLLPLRGTDRDVAGLSADSRKVEKDYLFVAIPGTELDGRSFLREAATKGATTFVIPTNTPLTDIPDDAAVLETDNPRLALAALAAALTPQQPSFIAAVTGTSGKTSTAKFTMDLWNACNHPAASIGTLGLITPRQSHYSSRTTPDPVDLHAMLDEAAREGVTHAAIEASSIGIIQSRMDFVKLGAAAFTNLSRDHLDYHGTMEAYLEAKLRLFTTLLPKGAPAVLNADVPEYDKLHTTAREHGLNEISYGQLGKDLHILQFEPCANGQKLSFEAWGIKYNVTLPVIGSFQVWNSLCALGLVIGSGVPPDQAIAALEKISSVPGRLQYVGTTRAGGTVFVDYAHKPDALQNVLSGLRPHTRAHHGKLGVVFGCGGNRDKGKRPMMGKIAQELADWTIVTDDNPRYENPDEIRKEIIAGCTNSASLKEIADRKKAIFEATSCLQSGDVLVIAGKGHESGQIVGDIVHPFDDVRVAEEAIKEVS